MEADSLWNTATYAVIAVAGLVLYLFYTYVISCYMFMRTYASYGIHLITCNDM